MKAIEAYHDLSSLYKDNTVSRVISSAMLIISSLTLLTRSFFIFFDQLCMARNKGFSLFTGDLRSLLRLYDVLVLIHAPDLSFDRLVVSDELSLSSEELRFRFFVGR